MGTKVITFAALLSVVSAAFACGMARADLMAAGVHAMATADDTSAMSDDPMKDCRGTGTSQSNAPLPCGALSAVTEIVTPSISPALADPIGETYYPAGPSIRNWLIQPEPYPPRT